MSKNMKKNLAIFSAFTMAMASTGSLTAVAESEAASGMTSFPFVIEGEDMTDATFWDKIYADEFPGFSGKGFTYITGGPVSFDLTVPEDGMYQVTVRGLQILDKEEPRMETISVNGVEYSKYIPYTTDWTDFDFGRVRLKKGDNTISFLNKYGYMAIDKVTVDNASFPDVQAQADAVPCDPKATAETKSLMKFLHSVYGKGILSGQQEIYGGGHSVSTTIRYDAEADKCIDSDKKEYVIDRESEDIDKDGNKFYWHCSDDVRTYTYDEQNRNYKYDYYDQEFDAYKEMTGEYPAIRGFDFMNYNPLYGWDDGSTQRAIEWATKRNGIVTACWHINIPVDFENYTPGDAVGWQECTYKNNASFDVSNAVKEGTKENEYLNMAIEDLATQFKLIQDAGVPILFRPFHEAEGNGGLDGKGAWFWWSQNGAEPYKALYKYLYTQLTEKYDLHNIIWEQNLYAWSDDSAQWYVGDDYVDIVGFDKYDTVYNRHDGLTSGPNEDCNSDVYWSLNKYVNGKKMAAIMENSTIPSLSNLTTEKASWLYFCTWYDNGQDNFLTGDDYNNSATVAELGKSDYCINLEDLPKDLYKSSGEDPILKVKLYGDANNNGKIEIADAVLIMQAIANKDAFGVGGTDAYALTPQGKVNADCYDPGSDLTGLDALAVQRKLVNLVELPEMPES